MAEYIEREELVRQIICNMAEFIGAPDDVLKHDEQCNYAIFCVESAPSADVAPVRHGRWIEDGDCQICSECGEEHCWDEYRAAYCDSCGTKMDGETEGNDG